MAALFPSYVITVLELFQKHGFEAYVVGGAVRDLLCGKHPHDYDIVTSARPEETRRLCKGAGLSVVENRGENFGVLVLLVEGRAVEVAAYRKETYGTDAHRPNGVAYCQTLEEDLARRDFTVNAMAMDLAGNLTDPYGGRHDLEHHVLAWLDPLRPVLPKMPCACFEPAVLSHSSALFLKPVSSRQSRRKPCA